MLKKLDKDHLSCMIHVTDLLLFLSNPKVEIREARKIPKIFSLNPKNVKRNE